MVKELTESMHDIQENSVLQEKEEFDEIEGMYRGN